MIVKEFIKMIHKVDLTDDELERIAAELERNTFLMFLPRFNLLPVNFTKQWRAYIDRQTALRNDGQVHDEQDIGRADVMSVHDPIFSHKRNITLEKLQKKGFSMSDKSDLIAEVKGMAEAERRDDIVDYLDFVSGELRGGKTEEEIVLSLAYYLQLENTEDKLSVFSPLEDAMNAYRDGGGYYTDERHKTYSCMPGLAERLVDRVGVLMSSTEINAEDENAYEKYASEVLMHYQGQGKGMRALLSALWQGLDMPELKWRNVALKKYELTYMGKPLSQLSTIEKRACVHAIHVHSTSEDKLDKYAEQIQAIATSESMSLDDLKGFSIFRKLYKSGKLMNDGLAKRVAGSEQGAVRLIKNSFLTRFGIMRDDAGHYPGLSEIREKLVVYAQGQASEKFDRLSGFMDKETDSWPEGFAYEPRTVNEFELEEGNIDDIAEQLQYNFYPYYNDQDSLMGPVSKALGLHESQLACVLLGVPDGIKGLFRELVATIESPSAARLYGTEQLKIDVDHDNRSRYDMAMNAVDFWRNGGGVDLLCTWEAGLDHNLLEAYIDGKVEISDEQYLECIRCHDTPDRMKALLLRHEIDRSNINRVGILVRNCVDVNTVFDDGETALIYAAQSSVPSMINLLVENGADVNAGARGEPGFTALVMAAINRKLEVVNALLEKGAKHKDLKYGDEPLLMWALRRKVKRIADVLLKAGADVNVCDNHGITPLMWAAEKGYSDIVNMLLDKGADVNVCDIKGETSLMQAIFHVAAHGEKTETVKMLLDAGADVSIQDRKGRTAYDIADSYGLSEITDMLDNHRRPGLSGR